MKDEETIAEEFDIELNRKSCEILTELKKLNFTPEYALELLAIHMALNQVIGALNKQLSEVMIKNGLVLDEMKHEYDKLTKTVKVDLNEMMQMRNSLLRQAVAHGIKITRTATAKKGGQGKAAKSEECKTEFLRMVDERTPAWNKTKEGLAEAILELKPAIVKYAKDQQYSAITASTRLPEKWLKEHWKLEKRAYKKTVTK